MSKHELYYGDNLKILQKYVPDESVDLIYIDPPFNTGKLQQRTEIQIEPDAAGEPGWFPRQDIPNPQRQNHTLHR